MGSSVGESFRDMLKYSCEKQATDLHICAGSVPLIRTNSTLKPVADAEVLYAPTIDKIVQLLLDEKKLEELITNRSLDFSFSVSGLGRFRCNIYSQRGTYALAIRNLPFDIPPLEMLGLPPSVETFIHRNKGLVLATGATGSGKSTTLASMIDRINSTYHYHVVTIEDPVEYMHKHKKSLMTQREIGPDAVSFASALRAALREDPDVIMVGEMRDSETVSIALTAAETGHLVLSTLHTVGAAKSIDRIIDSFPTNQQVQARSQLATVLEGVISQQLVPRADGKGMVLASEVMIITPAIRNLIREGKHYQVTSIMQTGLGQGMQLMDYDLARLCKQGIISEETAQMRAQDPTVFNQFLSRR